MLYFILIHSVHLKTYPFRNTYVDVAECLGVMGNVPDFLTVMIFNFELYSLTAVIVEMSEKNCGYTLYTPLKKCQNKNIEYNDTPYICKC